MEQSDGDVQCIVCKVVSSGEPLLVHCFKMVSLQLLLCGVLQEALASWMQEPCPGVALAFLGSKPPEQGSLLSRPISCMVCFLPLG